MSRVDLPGAPPEIGHPGTSGDAPVACPHLGLAADQFAHYGSAAPEHRCYLWMARERIDRAHQQRYCLTSSHRTCPWKTVTRRQPAEASENLATRLSQTVRERFDDLERATTRANWPRSVAALIVFLLEVLINVSVDVARTAAPHLARVGKTLLRLVRGGLETSLPWLARSVGYAARWSGRSLSRLSGRVGSALAARSKTNASAAPTTPAAETEYAEPLTVMLPSQPSDSNHVEREWAPNGLWVCGYCHAENAVNRAFCGRCRRLSDRLDEVLRSRRKLALLDGLKAVELGGEERAFRSFVLATLQDSRDALAWRWRARTAPTISDVVTSLERVARLQPGDPEIQADLVLARARLEIEGRIAAPVATDVAPPAAPRVSLGRRAVGFGRRLALELSSIPAFTLGLLVAGQPVRDLLAMLDLSDYASLLPNYRLPVARVSLPTSLQPPSLPPVSADLGALGLIVVAIGYFYLAFRLADASPGSRWLGVGAGLAALGSLWLVASSGGAVLLFGAFLGGLALLGREAPSARAQFVRKLDDYRIA